MLPDPPQPRPLAIPPYVGWAQTLNNAWADYQDECAELMRWMPNHPDLVGGIAVAPQYLAEDLETILQEQRNDSETYDQQFIRIVQTTSWALFRLQQLRITNEVRVRRYYRELEQQQRLAYQEFILATSEGAAYREAAIQFGRRFVFYAPNERVVKTDLPDEDHNCPICHQTYEEPDDDGAIEPAEALPCGHVFGSFCLDTWIQGSTIASAKCPMCRHRLNLRLVRPDEIAV